MARKTCAVSVQGFGDPVDHAVSVEAETLFEAAVRGLAALRLESWSSMDAGSAAFVTVTVQPPAVTHRVKVAELKAWLDGSGRSPADRIQRQRLRALLHGNETRTDAGGP